ncbi:RagB/SusD family nutrient uptake outer membrane protein [Arachidicoccus sp.]|uniref:RagB/SusD family nutrient uptake outer membrane protein n=1 Tax=Arachidicoccus sp. TaxID=1872624 RepID=UPI003D1F15B6
MIIISILLVSCSKSFTGAEAALQGQPTGTAFWANADAATAGRAVTAIYANLRSWNNVGMAPVCLENMGSDDAVKGSVANDATYVNLYDNFTVTASEGQLDGFWIGQYQNVNFCNEVIDNLPNISMDASLKARYIGEAKFVRAYSYFRLVRAFGNIPLVLSLPSTAEELNPKQVSSAKVYLAIEQDLTDAATVLPATYGPADIGRATKGAALALHAKVAMYQNKWSDVLTYTKQVMQSGVYSLFPDYYGMFRIANENCSESIFEIQCNYVAGNGDLSNSQYAQIQGNRDANAGWGFDVPTQNLVNAFETGDPRLQATVMMEGTVTPSGDAVPMASAGAPTMYNMKTYVPFAVATADNQGADQNFRVLRYADVLLMNAEANNQLGNTADALASLEMVRARARAQSVNPLVDLPKITTTDQTTLRTDIWHERRVELAMENDRYFDVIRQGRAATIFGPLGWKANKNEVWPIPQVEIDKSGGVLVQNQGY